MKKTTQETPFCTDPEHWSVLEQIAREGARQMLQLALENEVKEYLEVHKDLKDEQGRRVVVKNGYHPKRSLVTGLGPYSLLPHLKFNTKIIDITYSTCYI